MMTNQKIDTIVREFADEIKEASLGYWEFIYKGQFILAITDESHNRMRLISPVIASKKVNNKTLKICMEANFDRALDARYAISGDYLWSAFIHPLGELGDTQFVDAMNQVATLAMNYGGSYTSTDLLFGGQ